MGLPVEGVRPRHGANRPRPSDLARSAVTAIRVLVSGRVQGVGYRAWAVTEARKLELGGWVRNRHDGTVEMVLSGDEGAIRRMIGACHSGPPFARVDTVVEAVTDDSDVPSVFEQRSIA